MSKGTLIKHIVFWKIKPAGDKQAHVEIIREFKKRFASLKTIIPEILDAHIGYNFNAGPNDFTMCCDALFRNLTELETYIVHPEHLKLREWLNSVSYDKAVFDYEYDGELPGK